MDDWANLAVETVNQLVHISTRKEEFKNKALREELINAVAPNFIKGDGTSENSGLTNRRVNKLLKDEDIYKNKTMIEDDTGVLIAFL